MAKKEKMNKYSIPRIINDIQQLLELLKKYRFVSENLIELYNLQNLISGFQTSSVDKRRTFNTKDIIFHVSTSGMKSCPEDIKKISVILNLSYNLSDNLSDKTDCFTNYLLEIFIQGQSKESSDNIQSFSWHLDREETTTGDYIHPLYHFHAGGKKISEKNPGELLLISSPRIAHPPMDIILAIHFIILNFIHAKEFETQRKILEDDNYKALIEKAKKIIIDPYFDCIINNNNDSYTSSQLFPII